MSDESSQAMSAAIREAAKRGTHEVDLFPQPTISTPSTQPRYADVNAASSGRMPSPGVMGPGTVSPETLRAWERDQGYHSGTVEEALRDALWEKRLRKLGGLA